MSDLVEALAPKPLSWMLVSGPPRSGTSLLRAMLSEHPAVGLLQEYGLGALVQRLDVLMGGAPSPSTWVEEAPTPEAPDVLVRAAAFHRARSSRAAVARPSGQLAPAAFESVARGVFQALNPDKTLQWVGDKTPLRGPWEDVAALFERLHDLRLVFTIRRPRATLNSSLIRREATRAGRDAWPVTTVEQASCEWMDAMRRIEALRRAYGPAVHVLKYEDLCSRPADILGQVFAFLGLAPIASGLEVSVLPEEIDGLSASEAREVQARFADLEACWNELSPEEALAWAARDAVAYNPGEWVALAGLDADRYLDGGFYEAEPWGRWTCGGRAGLHLNPGRPGVAWLAELQIAHAFTGDQQTCDVVLEASGGPSQLFSLGPERSRMAILVPPGESGDLRLTLKVLHPKRPEEPPADARSIGVGVESFRLSPIQPMTSSLGPTDALQPPLTIAFILSTARAGSTWLNLVLGAHSWAAGMGEYRRLFDQRGHVACRLCEAEGLTDCSIYAGVEDAPEDQAFHFAARRTGKHILVDASKSLVWCARFLDRPDISPRLIHLVRHPAGFIESEVRRKPITPAKALEIWEERNRSIGQFVLASGYPAVTVAYDHLADNAEAELSKLCAFLGGRFEPQALEYWLEPPHGLGGNGAASLYLRNRPMRNFVSGDEGFYAGLTETPTRADDRWRDRLAFDVAEAARNSVFARRLAHRCGIEGWGEADPARSPSAFGADRNLQR